jgi:hypothetical protein
MGAIATVLDGGAKFKPSFLVDFEKCQPTENETELYNLAEGLIVKQQEVLQTMKGYLGCSELIRLAIQSPTEENKAACMKLLIPNVLILNSFYNHAKEMEQLFFKLLAALCSGDSNSFQQQQSLVKQLAKFIDFAMAYDDLKMTCPYINNDFSYYRRTMSGQRANGAVVVSPISDETANCLSLFYANPTPMLNVLKLCVQAKAGEVEKTNIIFGLSLMANICFNIVEFRRGADFDTLMYCLRAAVGATILVDSIYDPGIFHPKTKKPPIMAKFVVVIIKNFNEADVTSLINALRYNTKEADPRYFE